MKGKRFLSLLLCLVMVLGLLPTGVLAFSDDTIDVFKFGFLPLDDGKTTGTKVVTTFTVSYTDRDGVAQSYTNSTAGRGAAKTLSTTPDAATPLVQIPTNVDVTVTATAPDGYLFTNTNNAHLFSKANAFTTKNLITINGSSANVSENGKTITVVFKPNTTNAPSTIATGKFIYLGVYLALDGNEVTFYPYGDEDYKFKILTQHVAKGGKATEPTIDEIKKEAGEPSTYYLDLMEPEGWYTSKDFAEGTKWDFDTVVEKSMPLYAKMQVKADATAPAALTFNIYGKPSAFGTPTGLTVYRDEESGGLVSAPTSVQKTLTVPVGRAVGEDFIKSLPASGTKVTTTDDGVKGILPKNGAAYWKFCYTDSNGYEKELTADAIFSADTVLNSMSGNKNATPFFKINGYLEYSGTLTFITDPVTNPPAPITYQSTTTAYKLTAEQQQTIANWVKEKEESKGFGYYFRGWYASRAYVEPAWTFEPENGGSSWLYGDVDLYAKWVKRCTVTFDGNGKTINNWTDANFTKVVGAGDKVTAPAPSPQTNSFTFAGWYEDADCTPGKEWIFETGVIEDDKTLYAKWSETQKEIDVVFQHYTPKNYLSRTDAVTDKTYHKIPLAADAKYDGTKIPSLPAEDSNADRKLKYTKWEFNGTDGAVELTADTVLANYIDVDTTETLIVTAKADSYITFTYDSQGGSDVAQQKDVLATNGATATRPQNPTMSGKKFDGWFQDASCTQPFYFASDEKPTVVQQNTTLYAKWIDEPKYDVTFTVRPVGSATEVIENASVTVTNSKGETEQPKTGSPMTYALVNGTYTAVVSAPNYRSESSTITVNDAPQNITVPLTAFTAVEDITLSLTEVMKSKSYTLADSTSVTPNTITTPVTWSLKSAPDKVTLQNGVLSVAADAANGKVVLTAQIADGALSEDRLNTVPYTKDFELAVIPFCPTISFENGAGGSPENVSLPAPKRVNSEKKLELAEGENPSDPNGNWLFKGWYLESACTTPWEKDKTFDSDAILYAKWEEAPIDVEIVFEGNGGTANDGAVTKFSKLKSGSSFTLPANMFAKANSLFSGWSIKIGETTRVYTAGNSYSPLPRQAQITATAKWIDIGEAVTSDDISQSLGGITATNAGSYKPQLEAARDAAAESSTARTDLTLLGELVDLFEAAKMATVKITGTASANASERNAILSSVDGKNVEIVIDSSTGSGKTLPAEYQTDEYKSVWRSLSMKVGGTTSEPKLPVILTMPIPADLSEMAADTIRVLLYKGTEPEPVVMTPTVNGSNLTFAYDGNGRLAFVGKAISDAKDTRVTALEMRYNGTKMGYVTQDAEGNFTVTLPSTTSETILQDLNTGASNKWVTYMTVASQATVTPSDGAAQTAETWAKTGVVLTYSLNSANNYSKTRSFTVTAGDGTTTRNFTVTVMKNTENTPTYKIAVANISGGTVTATPNPAAAGEEVKLTIEPNDGKKLIAGSLSYCLQSAGAKSVPIDESTLTFIMPAGDININAQFEDDADAPIKNPPQITAFMINGVSAVINQDTKAITIILPYGTDLKHVAPTIVTANASKVEPSSAQRVDLSTPKAYKVYASNGAYVTYTVTAYTEEPSPTQSLWEKLQNQINSNPNWWELAEYQKKTGYYK